MNTMRRKDRRPPPRAPQRVLLGRTLPRGWSLFLGGRFPEETVTVFNRRGRCDSIIKLPTELDEAGQPLRAGATAELMLDAALGAEDVDLGHHQLADLIGVVGAMRADCPRLLVVANDDGCNDSDPEAG